MSDVRPSHLVSNSRPVNQQQYSLRYNPVIGRRSVQEHNGPFKALARKAGLGSALGYDPKGQSAFLAEKPIEKSFDTIKNIAQFLNRYHTKTQDDIVIEQDYTGKEYLKFKGDDHFKYDIKKYETKNSPDYYEVRLLKDYRKPKKFLKKDDFITLKIGAQDTDKLKEKLEWILQNPVSQAKLDYQHPKFMGKKYINFNENKVVANHDIQAFKSIGNPGVKEGYDSDIGGTDMHQVNYFGPRVSYQGYSGLENPKKPIKKVKDHFWGRIHGMHTHMLSSNVVDELVGNLVNMHYAKRGISPEARAQQVQNIREDFIFNISGNGSRNGRLLEDPSDIFDSPSKFQSFLSQFHLAANPNRGGRIWRDIPPSLSQTIALMYHPKGDGTVESHYDKNPEHYLKNLEKLKITVADKQFMTAHGRKILGIYIALKFIKHDLSQLKIDENSTQAEIKKWADLTKIHDDLFESTGDLKDYLRHDSSGFAQVRHSVVKHNIPTIKDSLGVDTTQPASKEQYTHIAEKTLYPLMLNYTQFESYLGLSRKIKGSTVLYNTLKSQIFDREIPDIVAGSATVMLLEGIDKISKRLKSIDEIVGQDANLKGVIAQFTHKVKQGDIDGATELFGRQTKRMFNMLDFEALFPKKPFQILQTEGLLWHKEVMKPIAPEYYTRNKNVFPGQYAPVYMIEKNGEILSAKLVEAIKTQARLIENVQKEMQENTVKSPYDTKAMQTLSANMQEASMHIAQKFIKDHKDFFMALPRQQQQNIINDVYKETYALQSLIGNVACVLATADEAAYGTKVELPKRDKKRNNILANRVKHYQNIGGE